MWRTFIVISIGWLMAISFIQPGSSRDDSHVPNTLTFFKQAQVRFFASTLTLQRAVQDLDAHQPQTLSVARQALKDCRMNYKQLSFFLDYFFGTEAYAFNAPAKYEVEEPDIEYEAPTGLQQVEALLFDKAPFEQQAALLAQMEVITKTAEDLPALLYDFKGTDAQVIESERLELVRVMTLYISGYDAPMLKSGLDEAAMALRAMDTVLTPYMAGWEKADSIHRLLNAGIKDLKDDFDAFDRLHFLTAYGLPLQRLLTGQGAHTVPALNEDVSLFDKRALRFGADTGDIALGRKLFTDKTLSGNGTRSCATCHQPGLYFTDGLPRNASLQGGLLPRHTPTLLYTAYQYAQFWDGRAVNPEQQVDMVLHSRQEMDANEAVLAKRFPHKEHIAALAAYVRTLSPFSAPFDAYMQGDSTALNQQQRLGFNLFMGKAQCGTCHFAPLFNGLTPPLYSRTEFEILGVPANSLLQPVADTDKGREAFFAINYYHGAFKTPTVRNSAVTAPYMHNGVLQTMDQLIDFYDKGGGAGIGLNVFNQTLSATPLQLTPDEKKALIAFIGSLTDKQGSF